MFGSTVSGSPRLLLLYYAGTALFMLLDYAFGINVRLTFLDPFPGWRMAYYGFCYLCLALLIWRPAWGALIGIAESLLTLSLIIISAAVRVLIVTDEMIDTGRGFVTMPEMVNFGLAFVVVYVSYTRNMTLVQGNRQ